MSGEPLEPGSESRAAPIDHPGAWRAADLGDLGAITFELQSRHRRALDRALRVARASRDDTESITREDFPLDDMADDIARIRAEVADGRGLVLLRGLPVERYSRADTNRLFWGLGTHFGIAVSQSLMGDRLGHVIDVSGDHPAERGYRSSRELDWHTDSDDFLMMLCVQRAKHGGESRFVSALTIYNEILALRPDLMQILMRGFRYHLRGEQADGEEPITSFRVPVFSRCDDAMSCVYLRAFIDMAAEDLGVPLSDAETNALDLFEAIAARADLRLSLELQPGDAYVANNYTILHSRTAFEDHPEPDRRRHFLRLWLKADARRPVVNAVRRFYRDDGIERRDGGSTLYVHGGA